MLNGYDIAYYALLGLTWPIWAIHKPTRDKVRDAFATRGGMILPRPGREPAALVHAVSVGELNAARGLIERLQTDRPGLHVIVTTTTKAGNDLARKLYAGRADVTVMRFPIDLSRAVSRMLDALRPNLVVLMELEVWPNVLKQCDMRKIPVVIANGRITESSFRKYRLLGPVVWSMFRRLTWCIAQDEVYASRFAALGVPRDRLEIAGTMKFDTASIGETVPGADELAREVDLPLPARSTDNASPARDLVWVAGSTGPGEEAIVLDLYAKLREKHPSLRLAIIPRKPERFDEVATLIESRGYACVRRSHSQAQSQSLVASNAPLPNPPPQTGEGKPVILGDTMGELRKFYALADVVFVGRTLVDLGPKQHGSDMIEPCALAKPTVVGPFTGNFEEPMRAFRAADAIAEATDADALLRQLDAWLADPVAASEMGKRAQQVVIAGKGSVSRHVELLLPLLN